MKNFSSLEKQLEILESRGLSIENKNKAVEYLLTNNYYNVINTYSKYFQVSPDVYVKGANFDEITQLKLFDKEIKNVIFKSILEAENHISSIIAYRFSEKYNEPYAYLQTNSYMKDNLFKVARNISMLSTTINRKKNEKQNSITHYYHNYNNVPLWVLINELTFGNVYHFYSILDHSLQNKIASDFSSFLLDNLNNLDTNNSYEKIVFDKNTASSFIKNIVEIRNVVAHDNKLLDYKCRDNTSYFKELHSLLDINKKQPRQDVYNTCVCLASFLSKNQFAQLHNTILKRVANLERKLDSISINVVLNSLGFPNDWNKDRIKLPQ